jgi:hypothetical protein
MTRLILCAVLLSGLASGQDLDRPLYGTPSDLHGLTRLFIDTGADVRARDRIVRELRASGIALQLVDDASAAQMLLEFGATVEHRVGGWVTNTHRDKDRRGENSVTTSTDQKIQNGVGTVYAVREGRLLIVDSFTDQKRTFLERDPATNFARAFLRLYRSVNGLTERR